MGALAEHLTEQAGPAELLEQPRRSPRPARRRASQPEGCRLGPEGRHSEQDRDGWNVLAEELVAFPSRAQRIWLERDQPRSQAAPRAYADAWLDRELTALAERRRAATEVVLQRGAAGLSTFSPGAGGPRWGDEKQIERAGRPLHRTESLPERGARAARAPAARTRTGAAALPRGLRRLLPGVAALAVLTSAWFGVGVLASSAHPTSVVRLPGSVPVRGGYAYTVRPGDTFWSIASRAEPRSDPRQLADQLQSQVGGSELEPGARLVLPR